MKSLKNRCAKIEIKAGLAELTEADVRRRLIRFRPKNYSTCIVGLDGYHLPRITSKSPCLWPIAGDKDFQLEARASVSFWIECGASLRKTSRRRSNR